VTATVDHWLTRCFWDAATSFSFSVDSAYERNRIGYGFSRAILLAACEPEYFAGLVAIARADRVLRDPRVREDTAAEMRAYVAAHPLTPAMLDGPREGRP